MSSVAAALSPKTSRVKRATAKDSAVKDYSYDPIAAKDFIALPGQMRRLLAPKFRSVAESNLVYLIAEKLWGMAARGYKENKPGPPKATTDAISDSDLLPELGCEDLKTVRNVVDTAFERGIIVMIPAGRGRWRYALPVENWKNVKVWEPKRKPPTVEDEVQSQEPEEVVPEGSAVSEDKANAHGNQFPRRSSKPLILQPGEKPKPIIFPGAPKSYKPPLFRTETRHAVEISASPLADQDTFEFVVRECGEAGRPPSVPKSSSSSSTKAPLSPQSKTPPIGKAEKSTATAFADAEQTTEIQNVLSPLFQAAFHKDCDRPFAEKIVAALDGAPPRFYLKNLVSRFDAAAVEKAGGDHYKLYDLLAAGIRKKGCGSGVFLSIAKEIGETWRKPGGIK